MVRVQAFPVTTANSVDVVSNTTEQATTIGFDFTVDTYGNTDNVKQEIYNLYEATGIEYWQNRLVLWGVPKDPTILFISDLNEPAYFPYPNNITVYDEPIVCVKPFLNDLLVFTATHVHLLSMNSDGSTFKTTVVQSNLSIDPWDRHLIQVVKNMVFFKSGNYFYMLVPKAQSTRQYRDWETDRKSTRLNSSHSAKSRMPSSA